MKLDFDANSGNTPVALSPSVLEEFKNWCRDFQRTEYGIDALKALAQIAPLNINDPGTFNVLYACFCSARFNPDDERKKNATRRSQGEKEEARYKAIKGVRKTIRETMPLGIAMFPPYEDGVSTKGLYGGDYPARTMERLDQLLVEFHSRLRHFTAHQQHSYKYGCLGYREPIHRGKGNQRKPETKTMLMFHLTLLFRHWPLPALPQFPVFSPKGLQPTMPRRGQPRYSLTAKFVVATYPPHEDGDSREMIDAAKVRNRLKALPSDLIFLGW